MNGTDGPCPCPLTEGNRRDDVPVTASGRIRGSRVARPNEYGGSPLVVRRCDGARGAARDRGRRNQPSWRGVGGARAVSGPRRSVSGGTSRAAGGGAINPTATVGAGAGSGAVPVRCRAMHAEQYASS